MEHSKNILKSLNQCAFNNAAQAFLSNLSYEDLQNLLLAIEHLLQFQQLSQLIKGRMIVMLYQRNDRTIYYTYFEILPLAQLKQQRSNLIAGAYSKKELKNILESYRSLVCKGRLIYGDQFSEIEQAILEPTLALAPIKRQTIAPNCQTVYQIILAFQKLKCCYQQQNSFTLNQETAQFFEQCLTFHTQMVYCHIHSIVDNLQHFAELSYRFQVYRNTVLSLHNLCPFKDAATTMKLWNSRMVEQYQRANNTFLKLLGLYAFQDQKCGFFSFQELKQQSYMMDYIEGLVDQSVTEDNVAFCGHSKQIFFGPYAKLQSSIVQWIAVNRRQIQGNIQPQQISKKLQNWVITGLKPSTLSKILYPFNDLANYGELSQKLCCRDDYFIENCARVNNLQFPDQNQVHLQCF